MSCENCSFCVADSGCDIEKWLDSEYVEPEKEEVDWTKVPIDTKVLVSFDGVNLYRRYFAGVSDRTNYPQVFANGGDSWSTLRTEMWKYIKLYEEDKE